MMAPQKGVREGAPDFVHYSPRRMVCPNYFLASALAPGAIRSNVPPDLPVCASEQTPAPAVTMIRHIPSGLRHPAPGGFRKEQS